jgi:hypothetical protein
MSTKALARTAAVASLLVLVACWDDNETATVAAVSTPAAASLTVGGTAATGAAVANASVTVKCASGNGSGVTGSDGSFSIPIEGGVAPCLLEVTQGSLKLHSLVERQASSQSGNATGRTPFCKPASPCPSDLKSGSGLQAATAAQVTANITPLSELLVAKVTGADPATAFASFDATTQAQLTPEALTQAVAAVVTAFQGVVDLSGLDPIKGPLVAASGSTAGNALDQRLDALAAALTAAQTTLAEVTTAVVTAAPVQTIVQPAAAACAGLRSGTYRAINPHETIHDPAYASHLLTIDATKLTVVDASAPGPQTPGTFTPDPSAPCKLTAPGDFGTGTAYVSRSGVIVNLSPSSTGPLRTSFIIPEQTIPLSQLAGTWNWLSYDRDGAGTPLLPKNGTAVINAAGKFVSGTECVGLTCTPWPTPSRRSDLTVHPAGGFSFTYTAASGQVDTVRVFAFATASGALSLFVLAPGEEGMSFLTKQVPRTLPAVGTVDKFWDLTVGTGSFSWAPTTGAAGSVTASLVDTTTTVTAVDTTAQTYTRTRASDGRIDGFKINDPRTGLRYRAPGASTNSAGPITLSGTINMPLTDTGITVYQSSESNRNFFGISVIHP